MTIALGIWQLERLVWKTAALAEIDEAETLPPVPLPAFPRPFERVVVDGQFLRSSAYYGAEVRDGGRGPVMGADIVNALVREGEPPIIVDRGWAPIDIQSDPPSGPLHIEGYVRPAAKVSWTSVKDDTERRRFFTLDPVAIGRSFGLENVEPFTIVVLGKSKDFPQPATKLPRPPNNHLSYAVTWFTLSLILLIVFSSFACETLRRETTS